MSHNPYLKFNNYVIRLLNAEDAEECVRFYLSNSQHLTPFETIFREYFEASYWQEKALQNKKNFENDISCCLNIFDNEALIGMINFTDIIRGPCHSCFLGYKIAANYQGKGIMKGCLEQAINYVFVELNLHRISANYLPHNIRSAQLLESLNFKKEGLAPKYLYINGEWQNHILTALINDNWRIK
jgi:ribosomal-protein-alanine N-acetyltransferase